VIARLRVLVAAIATDMVFVIAMASAHVTLATLDQTVHAWLLLCVWLDKVWLIAPLENAIALLASLAPLVNARRATLLAVRLTFVLATENVFVTRVSLIINAIVPLVIHHVLRMVELAIAELAFVQAPKLEQIVNATNVLLLAWLLLELLLVTVMVHVPASLDLLDLIVRVLLAPTTAMDMDHATAMEHAPVPLAGLVHFAIKKFVTAIA